MTERPLPAQPAPMRIALLLTVALVGPIQDRDTALNAALDAWVAMWNSYDLDEVDRLFVPDEAVSYFSSEYPGLIEGIEALRLHHRGFGFEPGGAATGSRLWLDEVVIRWEGDTALVMAQWLFAGAEAQDPPQQGPVSFVFVPRDGAYRILHAHFASAPEG